MLKACNQLITYKKPKTKCSVSNKETKVKIISLLPSSWICEKITDKFEASDHLDRLSRNLVMEQEILP